MRNFSPPPPIQLPPIPADQADLAVAAWRERVEIATYAPEDPDRYPMFLDRRVYQGSSGRVYPLAFHDRISREREQVSWDAVHLENRWLRLMVLPDLGGRIHVGLDKTNGYDFFYRNNVIKPALVGLAGPWISGGVEFNWPQHHRPATFQRVDVEIERHADGAVTVWCSDHEPFNRMKGMHGVTLHPDRATVELRVRLHNRSEEVQSFLWWANVGARVHDDYQSFFPRDVRVVADHAKRATTRFPRAEGRYYGVDYPARVTPEHPDADRLDWYRNIPVPTSYMCVDSKGDFFGGYDHAARAGFVHWADHRISPGKKQWTWGNAPFGRAWDDNLTDSDGPYVELMAGVYTDNQPDFSFLAPGETKSFVQQWFPLQEIGPVRQATPNAAVSLERFGPGLVRVGLTTTRVCDGARIVVTDPNGQVLLDARVNVGPGSPALRDVATDLDPDDIAVEATWDDDLLVRWKMPASSGDEIRPATEPPPPAEVASVEELYLTGRHLAQYRHATRVPEPYWQEALRRDPGDSRSATALAAGHYHRGEFNEAERLLRVAIVRLTHLNPNPEDGEAFYRLGLTLRRGGRLEEALDAFAKAGWNAAWRAPASFAMAELLAQDGRWAASLASLDDTLRRDTDHLAARDLRVLVLRSLGREREAEDQLAATRVLDPLDWWARDLANEPLTCDAQTVIDVALQYAGSGFLDNAARLLDLAFRRTLDEPWTGARPIAQYHRAYVLDLAGRHRDAADARAEAAAADQRYAFPGRLDDARALRAALMADPDDGRAAALLGHWCYDRGLREEAIALWRKAVSQDSADAVCWRNLAIAHYNVHQDSAAAMESFAHAREAAPNDGRLVYEQDQLALRIGAKPEARLAALNTQRSLVGDRDDLTIALADVLVSIRQPDDALSLISGRDFQPWEGGEGQALAAWERVHLRLGRQALHHGRLADADMYSAAALSPPMTLGEAPHPLANRADLLLLRGDVLTALGRDVEAEGAWRQAAEHEGDFQEMSPQHFSEKTYFQALAWRRLGDDARSAALLAELERHTEGMLATPSAQVDYFATSLPSLLLFDDDLQHRREDTAHFLRAQVHAAQGELTACREMLGKVLVRDPNHAGAHDLEWDLSDQEVEP